MVAAASEEAALAVDSDACHELVELVVFHPLAPVDQVEYALVEVGDAA